MIQKHLKDDVTFHQNRVRYFTKILRFLGGHPNWKTQILIESHHRQRHIGVVGRRQRKNRRNTQGQHHHGQKYQTLEKTPDPYVS